jgi:hypothetical protein
VTSSYALGLVGAVTAIVVVVEMMRRRHLREKYAVLWLVVAGATVVVAVAPGLLTWASEVLGVQLPSNLLFFAASMLLLIVSVQHSYEIGRLEAKSQTLAEELALLRLELDERWASAGPGEG